MATVCNCEVGLSNTGLPNCAPIADVTKRIILVPIFANDGTRNEYEVATTTFNQVFFDGKINEADASKRWFPLPDIENIEDVRADAILETLNSGKNIFVQQGIRSFLGLIIKQSPEYLSQLEAATCVKFGALVIDKKGNLIGNGASKAGYLRPIQIDNNTWYPRLIKATDTEVQKIQLGFEWDINEQDSNIRMVSANDIAIDLFDLRGLLDVYGTTPTAISTTGFTITLETFFGSMKDKVEVVGLLLADFDLYNVTDSLAVTILTVTENPDGTYAFTFAAQTSGDVLKLSVDKNGFDSTPLETVVITIP
jgi:hypothetical protein